MDGAAVRRELESHGLSRGLTALAGHYAAAAVRYDLDLACLERYLVPLCVELFALLVVPAVALAVHEQFDFICIVVIGPNVDLVPNAPVPVGEYMQDSLVSPL